MNYRSINSVVLVGRLGQDAEVKTSASGTAYVTVSVATQTLQKNAQGGWEHPTVWHNVVVFGKKAQSVGPYLKKGTVVAVQGQISYRDVEKDGVKRRFTDIVADDMQLITSSRDEAQTNASLVKTAEPRRTQPSAAPQGSFEDADLSF